MSEQIFEPVTAAPVTVDPRQFRNTLGQFASGVVVIGTDYQGETHGMTANAFMSGSMSPPLVIVSVDKRARMHSYLKISGSYSVSMLANDQEIMSRHFAGQPQTEHTVRFLRQHGQPVLEGAAAWITTNIVNQVDCGDHTLFIGQVTGMNCSPECGVLGFHRGQYFCR